MAVNNAKLDNLVLFIAAHPAVDTLGKTKLWKLIYYIDAQVLRDLGRSVTGSEYIKYAHGPVPSRGERQLKHLSKLGKVDIRYEDQGPYKRHSVSTAAKADLSVFSDDELKIMDSVCLALGSRPATWLSEESHREPAWVYAGLLDKMSPSLMLYGSAEDPDGL